MKYTVLQINCLKNNPYINWFSIYDFTNDFESALFVAKELIKKDTISRVHITEKKNVKKQDSHAQAVLRV